MNRWNQIACAFASAWFVAFAIVFCLHAAPAAAAAPAFQGLAGEWSGTEMINKRPVAVNLKLSGTESAKGGTEFHYGVPRSCGLKAEYSGESEGQQFFSFANSTGGVCDRLISGFLAVRLDRGGALTYEASSADGKTSMSGVLRRSGENAIARQLVGEWAGPATASRPPIRLDVSVRQGTIGDEAAQLHYGAPRSCQLTAEYSGIWNEQAALGIKKSTGGYCDRLIGGLITMKTDGDGALAFSISLIDGSAGDKGTLRRSP